MNWSTNSMPISEQEKPVLSRMLKLISERGDHLYEVGVQTSVIARMSPGWRNVLTRLEFVCKGKPRPDAFSFKYKDVVIIQRLLSHPAAASMLEKLSNEDLLDTGDPCGTVPMQARFPLDEPNRFHAREWTEWPADVFSLEPRISEFSFWSPSEPMVSVKLPYFPTTQHVLWQLFGLRSPNWMNYFRGQVVFVLPDFRARISRLTIALGYLKADFECVFLEPRELIAKVHADNASRILAQETVQLTGPLLQIDLADRPTFASVALIDSPAGETLDLKSFQEGAGWQQPGVILETSEQEIEQMLLVGESETLEFKVQMQKKSHLFLAKTAAAFANTKGGTIVFGVDDDHRVVGLENKGLSDTVTNVLRSYCDPSPSIETEVVQYNDKGLFLVKVIESKDRVISVRDHGLYIRANGTNRVPTADEMERLFKRRQGGLGPVFGG